MNTKTLMTSYNRAIGNYWYKRLFAAVVYLAIAFGAAAWAVDNGNLILYVIAIVAAYLGIANIVKAIQIIFARNGR